MEAIIASLPERVLNYKDSEGRTIIDYGFAPFKSIHIVDRVEEMTERSTFRIIRPHYIPCGEFMEKVEGNIQEAIDNKITRVFFNSNKSYKYPANSFEDDIYMLLDGGHIQVLSNYRELKSNGKQYHVDFMSSYQGLGNNITSYYNNGRETAKTVVLRSPVGPITNNLISLGYNYTDPKPYPDTITSKFIGYTNYTNARSKNQDILDMIDELKAKIEAL